MLDITFDVSVLDINKADIIYEAFNASISRLYKALTCLPFYHLKNR